MNQAHPFNPNWGQPKSQQKQTLCVKNLFLYRQPRVRSCTHCCHHFFIMLFLPGCEMMRHSAVAGVWWVSLEEQLPCPVPSQVKWQCLVLGAMGWMIWRTGRKRSLNIFRNVDHMLLQMKESMAQFVVHIQHIYSLAEITLNFILNPLANFDIGKKCFLIVLGWAPLLADSCNQCYFV